MATKAPPNTSGLAASIERGTLLKAAAGVLRTIETKVTIPVLTHLLIECGPEGLVLTGTNLDMQTTARVPAEVARPGAVTVQAQAFHDIVKKLPAEATVSITTDPATLRTTISSGRSRFVLPGLNVGDFPSFDAAAGFADSFEIAGSILANMLARSAFAISTEETRYYLNGIFCHVVEVEGEATLRLVATDGHRLARIDTPRASGLNPAMPGVIIPRKMVEAMKPLAEAAAETTVTIDVSPRLVRITAGTIDVVSKLIDGQFPDYARVIPTQFEREAVAPTVSLIEALGRVSTVSQDKTRGVKLDFQESALGITLRNPGESEAFDELEIELEGDPLSIGFNARFLADILAQTGGDTVRIKLGADALQPAVIGDKLAEGLFVLMPLRIP